MCFEIGMRATGKGCGRERVCACKSLLVEMGKGGIRYVG